MVVLKQQETCENGETVAVWLKDERETTLKRFYLEGDRVRLQPANVTMDPIFTPAENVEVQGRLVTVLRSNP
ncbi:MAG: SOS-response transcriptional repressor, LexA [Thermomicrobiales bacterium]|nr:SOS-response transcriptional repressor, LexA [Thermomicrobiales bacterium]